MGDTRRPVGLTVLAVVSAVMGLQSFFVAIGLFPLWLAAARQGRYGNEGFVWVELLSAASALAAAYGLWRRRRWTRIPFLIGMTATLGTWYFIAAFGLGDVGTVRTGLIMGLLLVVPLAVAGWLVRYVWQHT
jgi:hypothetical protein